MLCVKAHSRTLLRTTRRHIGIVLQGALRRTNYRTGFRRVRASSQLGWRAPLTEPVRRCGGADPAIGETVAIFLDVGVRQFDLDIGHIVDFESSRLAGRLVGHLAAPAKPHALLILEHSLHRHRHFVSERGMRHPGARSCAPATLCRAIPVVGTRPGPWCDVACASPAGHRRFAARKANGRRVDGRDRHRCRRVRLFRRDGREANPSPATASPVTRTTSRRRTC